MLTLTIVSLDAAWLSWLYAIIKDGSPVWLFASCAAAVALAVLTDRAMARR